MATRTRSAARRNRREEPTAGANHPPAWIKPQLAALVKQAPDGPDWLHELKLDGYRMHARLDAGRVNIRTRRGNVRWQYRAHEGPDRADNWQPRAGRLIDFLAWS